MVLIWLSFALLLGAASVLSVAFFRSRRVKSSEKIREAIVESGDSPGVVSREFAVGASVAAAYGGVSAATRRYSASEVDFADMQAEIVRAFTRLELELESTNPRSLMNNFNRSSIRSAKEASIV